MRTGYEMVTVSRRLRNGVVYEAGFEYDPCGWNPRQAKQMAQRYANDILDNLERSFRRLEITISEYEWNKPR